MPESLFKKETFLKKEQSLFFKKETFLKKELWHRCFHVNFAKFLRTPFLQNTSGRLLPNFKTYLSDLLIHDNKSAHKFSN